MSDNQEKNLDFQEGMDYGEIQELKDLKETIGKENLERMVPENAKEELKDMLDNIKNVVEDDGKSLEEHLKMSSSDLAVFQLYAKFQGWYDGRVDGIWGPASSQAFEEYKNSLESEQSESRDGEKGPGRGERASEIGVGIEESETSISTEISKEKGKPAGEFFEFVKNNPEVLDASNVSREKLWNVLETVRADNVDDFGKFLELTLHLYENNVDFSSTGNSLGELEKQKIRNLRDTIENASIEDQKGFWESLNDFLEELEDVDSQAQQEIDELKSFIQEELDEIKKDLKRSDKVDPSEFGESYAEKDIDLREGKNVIKLQPEVIDSGYEETTFSFRDKKMPFEVRVQGVEKRGGGEAGQKKVEYEMSIENKEDENIKVLSRELDEKGKYNIYYLDKGNRKVGSLSLDFADDNLEFQNCSLIEEDIDNMGEEFRKNPSEKLQEMKDFIHEGIFTKNSVEENYLYEINGEKIGVYEGLVDNLKEDFGSDVNEKVLSVAIREQLRKNSVNMEKYLGELDIAGFSGKFTGKMIVDGLDSEKVKEQYEEFSKMNVSPEVINDAMDDAQQLEALVSFDMDSILRWISDIDSDGTVGNYSEIFGEGQVNKVLSEAAEESGEEQVLGKIMSMAELGQPEAEYIEDGKSISKEEFINEAKDKIFLKQSFWKGLNRVSSVSGLTDFFAGRKSLSELIESQQNQRKQNMEKLLAIKFGENFKERYETKIEGRAEELYEELPEDVREEMSKEEWTDKVRVSGYNILIASQLTVDESGDTQKIEATGGGAGINFDLDTFIDNMSVNYGNIGGEQALGVSLGKELFADRTGNNKFSSYLGVGGDLSNGMFVPMLGVSDSIHLEETELLEWEDEKSVFNMGAFGGYAGSFFAGGGIGFERSRMKEIEGKLGMFEEKSDEIFDQIADNPEVSTEDIVEGFDVSEENKEFLQKMAESIKMLYNSFGLSEMPQEGQREAREDVIKPGLEDEYKRVLLESNEGWNFSGVGLGFAGIPIIGVRLENIKAEYTDKNVPETVGKRTESLKSSELGESEKINNLEDLDKYLEEDFINIEKVDGKDFLVIDVSEFDEKNEPYLLGVDPDLNVQREGYKFYIGGDLGKAGNITRGKVRLPEGHYSFVSIGDSGIEGDRVFNPIKLKNGGLLNEEKWQEEGIPEEGLSLEIRQGMDKVLEKQNSALEELKKSGLLEAINDSITPDLWHSKIQENPDIYKNIVDSIRGGGYSEVLDGSKLLNILDSDLRNEIQANRGDMKDKFIVERVLSNLFGDSNMEEKIAQYESLEQKEADIESKISEFESSLEEKGITVTDSAYFLSEEMQKELGYEGRMISKGNELFLSSSLEKLGETELAKEAKDIYTLRKDLKEFDNTDLFNEWRYNRAGGFLRTFRDWYNGKESGGELPIASKEKLDKISEEGIQGDPEGLEKGFGNDMNALIEARKNYLEEFEGEKAFKGVSTNEVIGFPFTYKVNVEGEEGPVPMYGATEVVDVNGDGKIDQNDYVKMEVSDNMRGKMFDMLPQDFKESLSEASGKSIDELRQKFIEKDGFEYDVIYYKWGTCFNDAIGITNLEIGGQEALMVNDGSLMVGNEVVDGSTNINLLGTVGVKEQSKGKSGGDGGDGGDGSEDPGSEPTDSPTEPPDGGGDGGGGGDHNDF